MFTGIVQAVGSVGAIRPDTLSLVLPEEFAPEGPSLGESITVNGACLTVTAVANRVASFDVSPETFGKTALGSLIVGSKVNLERSMRADGLFGGHIVQGHVDGVARVLTIHPKGDFTVMRFAAPGGFEALMIEKGSVAIDGISLTIVDLKDAEFEVWLVPHTLSETNLRDRKPGDLVNIEFDVIGKYVARLMAYSASPASNPESGQTP